MGASGFHANPIGQLRPVHHQLVHCLGNVRKILRGPGLTVWPPISITRPLLPGKRSGTVSCALRTADIGTEGCPSG